LQNRSQGQRRGGEDNPKTAIHPGELLLREERCTFHCFDRCDSFAQDWDQVDYQLHQGEKWLDGASHRVVHFQEGYSRRSGAPNLEIRSFASSRSIIWSSRSSRRAAVSSAMRSSFLE